MSVLSDIVGKTNELGTALTVVGTAFGVFKVKSKIQDSGGRVKKVYPQNEYATESFSREVCEFWCTLEW